MKRYTYEELEAFIYRADSVEKCETARQYIEGLSYLPETEKAHLLLNLEDWEMNFDEPDYAEYDDRDYSPSAPWNAPGMRVSDFISGVRYW